MNVNNCNHKLKTIGKLKNYKDKESIYCFRCEKNKECWVKCLCGADAELYVKRLDVFKCERCL